MKPNRLVKFSPEQKVRIVTDYNARVPIKDIMVRNKVSKATLYRIIRMTV